MLLLIDNYDSFTYNIVHYFCRLGVNVIVKRNDEVSISDIEKINPHQIVISPGPGNPSEAGLSLEIVAEFKGRIPILGVCLGHQCIVEYFGGMINRARQIMHGKTSAIIHNAERLFAGCRQPLQVMRYHSLVADPKHFPQELLVTAITDDQEVMACEHKNFPIWGVQFHPESIKTKNGLRLLNNFLMLSKKFNNPD